MENYVPNVHFEQIPIKNLVSNQDYQRALSERHIERTIQNFDINQINPVKVSRREGLNYVFNGQHTIEIIAAVSGSRETPVWCMIYDDLEYTHEADIFANQQKHVKPLTPYDIFIASLEADNDKQIVIKSIVESCGLKISHTRGHCCICAVNCLEQIFDKHGFQVLDRALKLIVGAWEGDIISLMASMIKGIAHLVVVYGDALKGDAFIQRVGTVSAREIARTAKDRRAGFIGYSEAILNIYNRKTKGGLQIHKLYTSTNMRESNVGDEKEG
ncbi:MAG: hypothetical protein FWD48_11965 [Oscillospiraceae bacterium]|nr:hypothetical protein [Oscillospiraceae bacterium]